MSERICSTPGCAGKVKARGLCQNHYMRQRRAQRAQAGLCSRASCRNPASEGGRCDAHHAEWLATRPLCSVKGCDEKAIARTWCATHYARWKRNGTPLLLTTEQRFFGSVEPGTDGCWTWTATRDDKGYGNFYVDDRTVKAHRWSYELLVCDSPEDLEIDHICLNKSCVNPWHCELVPRIENQRRRRGVFGSDLRKCIRGHRMTLENVYVNPSGVRCCRICMQESLRRSRQRREVNSGKE